jgi:hypothetical protein
VLTALNCFINTKTHLGSLNMKKNLNTKAASLPRNKKPSTPAFSGKVSGLLQSIEISQNAGRMTTTANGAITPVSTDNAVLDFFSAAGALRGKTETEILNLFAKAFRSNPLLAVKALFYFRDVRGGQGERRTFRIILKWLANEQPNVVSANLNNISFFGRFDDLLELFDTPVEKDMMTLINNQLYTDLSADAPSLVAKWVPSINTSSQLSRVQAARLAKFFNVSHRDYRRILSHLRAKIKIVETTMCQQKWGEINYEHLPSRAAMIYRKAFSKHDKDRYAGYLEAVKKGEKKINAGTLYPYDLCNKVRGFGAEDATLEAQWNALPNYFEGRPAGNRLVVADTSGSMESGMGSIRPIDVSLSLALYIAERNTGPYKDYFITFGANPTLQKISGRTLKERFASVDSPDWRNTNLQAVFDLVLNNAVKNRIEQKEMPTDIFVISDMQFDPSEQNYKSNFQVIQEKYEKAGYKAPRIIFWNVNASLGQAPVKAHDEGVVLVSGCSPSILTSILSGKSVTPTDLMLETLNKPRYNVISV